MTPPPDGDEGQAREDDEAPLDRPEQLREWFTAKYQRMADAERDPRYQAAVDRAIDELERALDDGPEPG